MHRKLLNGDSCRGEESRIEAGCWCIKSSQGVWLFHLGKGEGHPLSNCTGIAGTNQACLKQTGHLSLQSLSVRTYTFHIIHFWFLYIIWFLQGARIFFQNCGYYLVVETQVLKIQHHCFRYIIHQYTEQRGWGPGPNSILARWPATLGRPHRSREPRPHPL